MLSQRDKTLWRIYVSKLLELGITDIGPPPLECSPSDAFFYQAKYGSTPVSVEYLPYVRGHTGVCVVRYWGKYPGKMITLTAMGRDLVIQAHVDLL